ncbi:unnamed protein product [Rhodiola kirilowii]
MRSTATNKFLRIIATPYRALCRVRDLYVRSVTQCGQPASFVPSSSSRSNLPKSYSGASSSVSSVDSEDYRELVRAASVRTLADSMEVETTMRRRQQMRWPKSVPRSASVGVGMGRIDEEAPFEGGDDEVGVGQSSFGGAGKKSRADLLYPRSKSYAVAKINAAF